MFDKRSTLIEKTDGNLMTNGSLNCLVVLICSNWTKLKKFECKWKEVCLKLVLHHKYLHKYSIENVDQRI